MSTTHPNCPSSKGCWPMTSELRIQVKQLADGGWHWRLLNDTHVTVDQSNELRRTRRAAIREAKRRRSRLERIWAEHWEDAHE